MLVKGIDNSARFKCSFSRRLLRISEKSTFIQDNERILITGLISHVTPTGAEPVRVGFDPRPMLIPIAESTS
jgi:hypothetical protein